MSNFVDRTGCRYGRLTVIEKAEKPLRTTQTCVWWLCRCDCGAEVVVYGGNLTDGRTRSCGCLRSETASRMAKERWAKWRSR